jgi:predicted DCC family thiol-disulfide oxidoreductase YuxK
MPATYGRDATSFGVLYYDEDCGVCTVAVEWLLARLTSRVKVDLRGGSAAISELPLLGFNSTERISTMIFVERDGDVFTGSRAWARLLSLCRNPWQLVGRVLAAPIVRNVSDLAYNEFAEHRATVSALLGLRTCSIKLASGKLASGRPAESRATSEP